MKFNFRAGQDGNCMRAASAEPTLWATAWQWMVCAGLGLGTCGILTINYADSIAFFPLALLGLGSGLARGFVSGLSRRERGLLFVSALVPIVAIISIELGTLTSEGFHFMGRDLRWLLAIPVYLALQRGKIRLKFLGWAFSLGAVLAAGYALAQVGPAHSRASGVTGVAIVFGDLALLGGFCGAGILYALRSRKWWLFDCIGAGFGLLGGGLSSFLSGARGGWLALPCMVVFLVLAVSPGKASRRSRLAVAAASVLLVALALTFAALVPAASPVGSRLYHMVRDLNFNASDRAMAREGSIPCLNTHRFLTELRKVIVVAPDPTKTRAWLRVVRSGPEHAGCAGHSAYFLHVPYGYDWTTVAIPEAYLSGGVGEAGVLARGSGPSLLMASYRGRRTPIVASRVYRTFYAIGRYRRQWQLLLTVRPGAQLFFVPLQLRYGALSYAPLTNSVDERFEMWRAAFRMFRSHPLLGVGFGAYQQSARQLLAEGRADPAVTGYDHAHSDYFNTLASMGVVGFLVLLAVYLYPLLVFFRVKPGMSMESATAARMGAMVVISFMIFGLTETMFIHSLVISWYEIIVPALVVITLRKTVPGNGAGIANRDRGRGLI